MKKNIFIIAACLLAFGCNRTNGGDSDSDTIATNNSKTFATRTLAGEQNFLVSSEEEFPMAGNTIGLRNSYNIVWPAENMMSADAERELIHIYFCNDKIDDLETAAHRWLNDASFYAEDGAKVTPVDKIDDSSFYSYFKIESKCEQQDDIATLIIWRESCAVGAAHGFYSCEYVNVDVNSGNIIHLNDLVDTSQLGPVIVRAVEDLAVNKEVQEALFDQNPERLPVPADFTIDSTRSTITLVYQLYEIASYADGIQEIVLPIFWLSKHIPLTPYAKSLFGSGCSID